MTSKKRSRRILAIDWDARNLRVVHALLTKRGSKIDKLLSSVIPSDVDSSDPQAMGRHIRKVLDDEGIGTRHAIVDIPRSLATLNTLNLPSQFPDELPGIVHIQIAKQLPFAVSDAAIDFAVGPREPDATTAPVLVGAVRHEVIKQYVETAAAAGLRLDRIGLRPFANKAAVCKLLRHEMPERVLVVDVGPTLTEINVLKNALVFSRAASIAIPVNLESSSRLSLVLEDVASGGSGSEDIDDLGSRGGEGAFSQPVDKVVSQLVSEVTLSLEAYRASDPGARIDHAVVAGDVGVEEALAQAIQKRLRMTAEVYNPASSFGWEPDEGADAAGFAAALGLVISHCEEDEDCFDFLHPKRSISQTEQRLKRVPYAAAAVIFFLAAVGLVFAQMTKPKRDRLATLEKRIQEIQEMEADQKKFLRAVESVREFDQDQFVWVDELYDIISQLPPQEELVLTQLDMDQRDGRVVLKTKSKQRETPTVAIRKLEAFRREGRDRPRFKVSMGAQTEKPGEFYPFVQDLRIEILKDSPQKKKGGA